MADASSHPANPDRPATWTYHTIIQGITHDTHQCDSWLVHYVQALAFLNATLAGVAGQIDSAILGLLPAECARNLEAHGTIGDLRWDDNALHERLRREDDEIHDLRIQSLHADDDIYDLREQASRADHLINRLGARLSQPTLPLPSARA